MEDGGGKILLHKMWNTKWKAEFQPVSKEGNAAKYNGHKPGGSSCTGMNAWGLLSPFSLSPVQNGVAGAGFGSGPSGAEIKPLKLCPGPSASFSPGFPRSCSSHPVRRGPFPMKICKSHCEPGTPLAWSSFGQCWHPARLRMQLTPYENGDVKAEEEKWCNFFSS